MAAASARAVQALPVLPPDGDSTRFGQVQNASDLSTERTAPNMDPLDGAVPPDQRLINRMNSEYDVRSRVPIVTGRLSHSAYTRATAWAAIASPRPIGPSFSIVLAFTLTCSTVTFNAAAALAAISAK